jgi:hypothetical protein
MQQPVPAPPCTHKVPSKPIISRQMLPIKPSPGLPILASLVIVHIATGMPPRYILSVAPMEPVVGIPTTDGFRSQLLLPLAPFSGFPFPP